MYIGASTFEACFATKSDTILTYSVADITTVATLTFPLQATSEKVASKLQQEALAYTFSCFPFDTTHNWSWLLKDTHKALQVKIIFFQMSFVL